MPDLRRLRIVVLALAAIGPGRVVAQAPADAPGAAPAPVPPVPPTPAEEAIDAAIKKLRAIERVSADVELKVDMLGQQFRLTGQYLKDQGSKIKMLLTLVGLGDAKGRMLQVSDGKTMLDYRQVLDSQSCDKLDVASVSKRLDSPDCDPAFREQMVSRLGFAGPDALLAGLRGSIGFNQMEEATVDGRPSLILRGEWKNRATLTGPGQQPFPPGFPLPAYVPALAEVTIGKDDGWPYRLVMSGKAALGPLKSPQPTEEGRPRGPKMPVTKERPSRLVLTYSNLSFSPKVDQASFFFQPPPNVPVRDLTPELTAFLDQHLADRAAAKRDTGASKEAGGALLDQGLTVPKTSVDPATDAPTKAP